MHKNLNTFFNTLKKCDIKKESFSEKTNSLTVEKLHISNLSSEEINSLNIIEHINGDLIIDVKYIKNITTFNFLKSVNNLTINNMDSLESINGFNSLEKIKSLTIDNNKLLEEIYGFNKLFYLHSTIDGAIKIINNKHLKKVSFLRGLKRVESSLYLHYNALETLEGLENLEFVDASLSLSSNNLTSLQELENLKVVNGMLGIVNNRLINLDGLENLKHLKTIKWNGKERTIALFNNQKLEDITALSNVTTNNNIIILEIDSFSQYLFKPSLSSSFGQNVLKFFDHHNNTVITQDIISNFIKIKNIKSPNDNSDEKHPLNNLIEGIGVGFDKNPPYGSISKKSWSTISVGKSYFEMYPEPIIIDIKLHKLETFNAIGIWSSRITFGNSIKNFTLEFSSTGDDSKLSAPISKIATEINPFDIELFNFEKQEANFIRLKIISNHKEVNLGGDRVGFQEITIIKNFHTLKQKIDNTTSNICQYDFIRPLIEKHINDDEYFALNIRPEFSLDNIWKENMTYHEFISARGLGGTGVQLKRINLSKWGDKIYMHHFLKEHGIKGMPIILYSNRPDDDFIDKVKVLYENGMKSFVIKMSHLGDSVGVIRVKDGLFITPNETKKKTEQYGTKVDFEYLSNQIKIQWYNKQYHEDWVSNMISPGVILEELLNDPTELKFSVIFGKVVGFFIGKKGFPSYDSSGKALKDENEVLPFWWKEALQQAERTASIIKADHLRIDLFYHNNEVIVSEVNWNGGERRENHKEIAKQLNLGYKLRQRHINRGINEK